MEQFEYRVTEPVGIHARPASILAKAAISYKSNIMIEKDGKAADVKRLIALMSLGVKCNEKVLFKIEGVDEVVAAKELEAFCKENL
jgi:phosphocarrier protein